MNFRDSAARPGPRKEVVEVLGGFFLAPMMRVNPASRYANVGKALA